MNIKASLTLLTALLLAPLAALCGADVPNEADATIYVRDFGAIPGDGKDDVPAIRAVFKAAAGKKHVTIIFETGNYECDQPEGNCLSITGIDGLTLVGAIDAKGEPATRLVRRHSVKKPTATISVSGCVDFVMRNFAFDNSPALSSAGFVTSKQGDTITVEVLDGLPAKEGTRPYSANLWDPKSRTLRPVPSVTYAGDVDQHKLVWKKEMGGNGRRLSLKGDYVASKVEVGDLLSWHSCLSDKHLYFRDCKHVDLSNLRVVNGCGIVMHHCKDVTGRKVVCRPEGNQLAVSSHDAWFLWAGRGKFLIEDSHIEGCRWDGQNVHGSFFKLTEIIDDKTIKATKFGGAFFPLEQGSQVVFWNGPTPIERTVAKCDGRALANAKVRGITPAEMTLSLTEPIPSFATKDCLLSVLDWDITAYTLKNCVFRNVAGCANIIRNQHAVLEHCTFDHIMYPAILVGASVAEGEGTFPQDVTIRGCVFRNCGWVSRQGAKGCVGIRNAGAYDAVGEGLGPQHLFTNPDRKNVGADGPYMGRISLTGNRFEDSELGIAISHAREVVLQSNVFKNVNTPYELKSGDKTKVTEQ